MVRAPCLAPLASEETFVVMASIMATLPPSGEGGATGALEGAAEVHPAPRQEPAGAEERRESDAEVEAAVAWHVPVADDARARRDEAGRRAREVHRALRRAQEEER